MHRFLTVRPPRPTVWLLGVLTLAVACSLNVTSAASEPVRDAFMLGFSYANGHNAYSLDPRFDPKTRETYDSFMAEATRYGKALAVTVDTSTPKAATSPGSHQVEVLEAGIRSVGLLAIEVHARHGDPAAAALELGYRSAVAIEYVPQLNPARQRHVAEEFRELATRMRLPLSLVNRYASDLIGSKKRADNVSAMFAFKNGVLRHYEDLSIATPEGASRMLNVWLMGWKLSLAALGQSRGAASSTVERMFEECRTRAATLGVRLPALPEAASASPTDTARALHYLMKQAGESVGGQLSALHGPRASALFELSVKSTMALLLYGPEDEMGQTLAQVIERSGRAAALPEPIWAPVVLRMRQREREDDVKREIQALDERVRQYFARRAQGGR